MYVHSLTREREKLTEGGHTDTELSEEGRQLELGFWSKKESLCLADREASGAVLPQCFGKFQKERCRVTL